MIHHLAVIFTPETVGIFTQVSPARIPAKWGLYKLTAIFAEEEKKTKQREVFVGVILNYCGYGYCCYLLPLINQDNCTQYLKVFIKGRNGMKVIKKDVKIPVSYLGNSASRLIIKKVITINKNYRRVVVCHGQHSFQGSFNVQYVVYCEHDSTRQLSYAFNWSVVRVYSSVPQKLFQSRNTWKGGIARTGTTMTSLHLERAM